MKVTRRAAFEFLATAAAAALTEQAADAQQSAAPAGVVALKWMGGEVPPIGTGVSFGVPFPRGAVAKTQAFSLGPGVPLQTWPLAYWPDGSLKFVGFATSVPASAPAEFQLLPGASAAPSAPVQVRRSADSLIVDTGALQCTIPAQGPNFIASMSRGGREVGGAATLLCTTEVRSADGSTRPAEYRSQVRSAVAEQSGPVRGVVRIDGVHRALDGTREWLPFTLRLYFYAGQSQVRMVHSFIFDGDQEKDFIRGLGVSFAVPLREQVHNRHVQFTSENGGVWAEPVQPATGRRPLAAPGSRASLFADQLAGRRLPNKETFDAAGQKLLTDWAVWDSFRLLQLNADGFTIQKRTNPQSCWLDASWGRRASGIAFVGDVSGGLGIGLRNMWQSHPASLEVTGASGASAEVRAWLWSPAAPAMDLRHYDIKAHDLDSSYEDVQPGFSTPHGIARTSELMLMPSVAVPTHEETARNAAALQSPPLLLASPEYIYSAKVFGIWSLPDRSVPAKAAVEDRLDAAFAYYRNEVEQRHWYGFWNYGDVMHQHDGPRHEWRYDVGGFAWDNTELGTDMWLWYSFLRSGRADMFRMAEAMTRHTSEVDVYHLGRFAGLGSRHNVRHWGCGAKESRISQAAYRRFYYYLTTDERTGDLMRAVVDIDYKLLEIDPMRLASPPTTPAKYPARVRGGPDWLAFAGNWMTEWERTGETKYRDKIVAGMDSIAAMPFGFLTGPNQLYGYEPATGRMFPLSPEGFGVYNLTTIMGGGEVIFELNELIHHPGWRKAWLQYCRLNGARKDVASRDMATGTEGGDGAFAAHARLAAYVFRETQNPAFAATAWNRLRLPSYAAAHVPAPQVPEPLDEIAGVSTNTTAQGCLEAIELLEMCGGSVPAAIR